jgi:hypothetical protein
MTKYDQKNVKTAFPHPVSTDLAGRAISTNPDLFPVIPAYSRQKNVKTAPTNTSKGY